MQTIVKILLRLQFKSLTVYKNPTVIGTHLLRTSLRHPLPPPKSLMKLIAFVLFFTYLEELLLLSKHVPTNMED